MKTFICGHPTKNGESKLNGDCILEKNIIGEVAIELNRITAILNRNKVFVVYQENAIWNVCVDRSPKESIEFLKKLIEDGKK